VSGNTPDADDPYRFVGSQGIIQELPDLYFMRARYYFADAAVFLSTDPIKNIGAGWQPKLYQYSGANPLSFNDPSGESYVHAFLATDAALNSINDVLQVGEAQSAVFAGDITQDEMLRRSDTSMADYSWGKMGASVVLDQAGLLGADHMVELFWDAERKPLKKRFGDAMPGGGFVKTPITATKIVANSIEGTFEHSARFANNAFLWATNDPMPSNGGNYANSTPAVMGNGTSRGASGGGGSTNSSKSNKAAAAGSRAVSLNSTQSTRAASPTLNDKTSTPAIITNKSGGSSIGSRISTAANKVTTTAKSAVSSIKKTAAKVIKSISSFFGGKKK